MSRWQPGCSLTHTGKPPAIWEVSAWALAQGKGWEGKGDRGQRRFLEFNREKFVARPLEGNETNQAGIKPRL